MLPKITDRPLGEILGELSTSGHAIFETWHRRKDGTTVPVEINVHIDNLKGKQVAISVVRDITERKRAEDALHQANRKLNLLSGITRHDINNQLTMLQGFLALLEQKRTDPTFKDYFQKAKTTAEQISASIRFTKEYESIGVNAPVWQDCRALVDTAAQQVTPGRVMVINDLPAGTEVFADPLVRKVFYNLIDNALRYGGSDMTKIRFFSSETDNGLILTCEDDGDGINGDDKKRLFERGFGKNTGLGLFLSCEILSITGITITENSVPGNGARFEITVPGGGYRVRGKE